MTKARKVGDWKGIAAGRAHKVREMRTGRGLSNIPNPGDTGSAAYRRLQARLAGKSGR